MWDACTLEGNSSKPPYKKLSSGEGKHTASMDVACWRCDGAQQRTSFASKVMSSRVQHVTEKRLKKKKQGQEVYQVGGVALDVRSGIWGKTGKKKKKKKKG